MKGFVVQIFIVIIVFNVVSVIRESSMLSSWQHDTAPNFELIDLQNNSQFLLKTKQAVAMHPNDKTVLYFFAPWCSICRVSIGNLQKLYARDDDITIVAVALDYIDKSEVENFADKLQLSFPIVLGTEEVKQAYQVSAYPSYYVIDKNNNITHRSMGYSTELGLFLRSL